MIDANKQMIHPDSELLAAFAEARLSAHERESMLEHLADCADCREVLFLISAATPVEMAASKKAEPALRGLFGWQLAAVSVALLATVSVLGWKLLSPKHDASTESTARNQTSAPLVQTKSAPQVAAPAAETKGVASQKTPQASAAPAEKIAPGASGTMSPLGQGFVASNAIAPQRSVAIEGAPVTPLQSGRFENAKPTEATSNLLMQNEEQKQKLQANFARSLEKQRTAAPAPQRSATTTVAVSADNAPELQTETSSAQLLPMTSNSNAYANQMTQMETNARSLKKAKAFRTLSKVTLGEQLFSLDASGRLFVSADKGVNLREIPKQWTGRAVLIEKINLSLQNEVNGIGGIGSVDALELTTDKNAKWVSSDGGTSWSLQK